MEWVHVVIWAASMAAGLGVAIIAPALRRREVTCPSRTDGTITVVGIMLIVASSVGLLAEVTL